MSVHRRRAAFSLLGIFLTLLALLSQHNLARNHGSAELHNGQASTDGLPAAPPKRSLWTSLGPLQTSQSMSIGGTHSDRQKQETDYTRTLVIPRMKDDDISWIAEELPDLNTSVYVANDPLSPLHSPKNKGHEVMVYLTYIIDHYGELPDVVMFMHAHRWTHHNNDLLGSDAVQMIRRLSNVHVSLQGYVNMRCRWAPGCPVWLHPDSAGENLAKQEEAVLSEAWNELFPQHPLPTTLSQPCCAQFALSQQRILSIPLSQFTFFRDWISRTPLSDYISGRIWEYSWQYIFTNQSVSCPAEHLCYCGAFGVCFGGAVEFGYYEEMRSMKLDYEAQIEGFQRQGGLTNVAGQRSSNTDLSRQELDTQSYLQAQIKALDKEMAARKKEAIERGNDPRKRAVECGS